MFGMIKIMFGVTQRSMSVVFPILVVTAVRGSQPGDGSTSTNMTNIVILWSKKEQQQRPGMLILIQK